MVLSNLLGTYITYLKTNNCVFKQFDDDADFNPVRFETTVDSICGQYYCNNRGEWVLPAPDFPIQSLNPVATNTDTNTIYTHNKYKYK